MIRSMTGYGSAEFERNGQRLSAEIRSVNHRFCEVSVRAPKLVLLFEDQIRQLIQDRFSRGKFNLGVSWTGAGGSGEVLKLNEPVADRYVALMQQLRERYQISGRRGARDAGGAPGPVHLGTRRGLGRGDLGAGARGGRPGLREHEPHEGARGPSAGRRPGQAARHRARAARQGVAARAAAAARGQATACSARLKPLLDDVEMDPTRLAQEMAHAWPTGSTAPRSACGSTAHLDQFQHLIDGPEMAGRKLNFLLQEMNREANTIGSKANDVEIAHAVIVMKEEIERLREQVQNVE